MIRALLAERRLSKPPDAAASKHPALLVDMELWLLAGVQICSSPNRADGLQRLTAAACPTSRARVWVLHRNLEERHLVWSWIKVGMFVDDNSFEP